MTEPLALDRGRIRTLASMLVTAGRISAYSYEPVEGLWTITYRDGTHSHPRGSTQFLPFLRDFSQGLQLH